MGLKWHNRRYLRQSKNEKAALSSKKVFKKAAERVGLNTEKVAMQVNKLQQKVESHSSADLIRLLMS